MKLGAAAAALVLVALSPLASARAQLPPPPPPPPSSESASLPSPSPPPRRPAPSAPVAAPVRPSVRREVYVERERERDEAPPARTGFQLALRSGYSFALGRVTAASGGEMSNTFSGQVPVLVEAGAKITPRVFLGGYLGFAFGGASGAFHRAYCGTGASCVSSAFRLGVEAQYHFRPAERWDPWVGYGLGFEWIGVTSSSSGIDSTLGYSGLELAHLTGGVDVRLSRTLAVGPLIDLGIGRYGSYRQSQNGSASDGDVASGALHEWLTLGARVTFLP